MPGLAVYVMGSPFRRSEKLEYVYGAAAAEALDPVAPLLDPNVYDSTGLVLVPDIYSVWPQVSAFPRSESYSEVLEKLQSYMERHCGLRLPLSACRRTVYRAVPWRGVMGGWRFTATPGDALAFTLYAVLETVQQSRRPPSVIRVLLDEEGHSALQALSLEAAAAAAALIGAGLEAVAAEQRPYPAKRGDAVELIEYMSMDSIGALRYTVSLAPGKLPKRMLEPRTPKGRAPAPGREQLLTLLSLLFARRRWLLPLTYSACGAGDPAGKLTKLLHRAIEAYIAATQLSKKKIGGIMMHHLGFQLEAVRALAAGAAVEAAAARTIRSLYDCEDVYRKGLPSRVLEALEEVLGPDDTPRECLEEGEAGPRLREGCLRKLRVAAAEEAGLTAP
ncbi:hypothetical protein Pyrde_0542 [Pyrodictium delaneyi]|uniref:Uncharacterized protein n=1 Tax=Pyrodictium delaneyi TaxID=1273541 RepID=A0A0P0N3E8_9CREN|nr:hypothetical protein [Pyrodictium delaneyi]ALL00592.1 hypothetical protein Pyrde_0542 [Pyrodictium delaneyi]OWJ54052.1 hypothetical protein Pdsh_09295 [Pyrodictium delaneyi]